MALMLGRAIMYCLALSYLFFGEYLGIYIYEYFRLRTSNDYKQYVLYIIFPRPFVLPSGEDILTGETDDNE